jgi:hypothetical protein
MLLDIQCAMDGSSMEVVFRVAFWRFTNVRMDHLQGTGNPMRSGETSSAINANALRMKRQRENR